MGLKLHHLYRAPTINPINHKARSVPIFNVVNVYGRVFFFSWFGFLIAFWSWYAFPPLMTITIRRDLGLTNNDVANSNIAALTATLIVRFICGPLCDKFGPRKVFAFTLLAGAIPTALAGTVTTPGGLITLRFFVGILGGVFVPCQVWCTGFFDKNVVGTANALAGGWGNAGGGITYFVMPAIYDSLVRQRGLTSRVAWRVSFIVPFIMITSTAIAMLIFCPDTPVGKWSERHNAVAATTAAVGDATPDAASDSDDAKRANSDTGKDLEKKRDTAGLEAGTPDLAVGEVADVREAQGEVVQAPTGKEIGKIFISLQTIALTMPYFCSFGGELAINSILGSYYLKNFPNLGQTGSGRWAAMFGLLNVITRPAGGFIGDLIYKYTNKSLWAKKMWIVFVGVVSGIFLIIIGVYDPKDLSTMIGLIAGMAFFHEAGNGANFALVPHVHPHANGVLSGMVGGTGNFGGVIFAIMFRYHGTNYHTVIWIMGIMYIGINLAVAWIPPLPRGQIGGH
ncbi:hypothetical protein CAC42_1332 [Sphaceloma murrayae]|uniref:Nitrate/nitrite transporter n=1 Tax=Sphaceloma murrayae TaxID=2082308 RepID=A0A2K1QG31_9PEZI|nr:hypothetical protein CAC42_1332 [Sphaceloma murrayae]